MEALTIVKDLFQIRTVSVKKNQVYNNEQCSTQATNIKAVYKKSFLKEF